MLQQPIVLCTVYMFKAMITTTQQSTVHCQPGENTQNYSPHLARFSYTSVRMTFRNSNILGPFCLWWCSRWGQCVNTERNPKMTNWKSFTLLPLIFCLTYLVVGIQLLESTIPALEVWLMYIEKYGVGAKDAIASTSSSCCSFLELCYELWQHRLNVYQSQAAQRQLKVGALSAP